MVAHGVCSICPWNRTRIVGCPGHVPGLALALSLLCPGSRKIPTSTRDSEAVTLHDKRTCGVLVHSPREQFREFTANCLIYMSTKHLRHSLNESEFPVSLSDLPVRVFQSIPSAVEPLAEKRRNNPLPQHRLSLCRNLSSPPGLPVGSTALPRFRYFPRPEINRMSLYRISSTAAVHGMSTRTSKSGRKPQ